jgi:hypothetical protein
MSSTVFGWYKEVNGYRLCDLSSMDSDCDLVIDKFEIAPIQRLADKVRCSERFIRHLFSILGFEEDKFRVIRSNDLVYLGTKTDVDASFIDKSDADLLGLEIATYKDEYKRALAGLNYIIERSLKSGAVRALIEVVLTGTCIVGEGDAFWVVVYHSNAFPITVFPEEPMYEEVEKVVRSELEKLVRGGEA